MADEIRLGHTAERVQRIFATHDAIAATFGGLTAKLMEETKDEVRESCVRVIPIAGEKRQPRQRTIVAAGRGVRVKDFFAAAVPDALGIAAVKSTASQAYVATRKPKRAAF